MTQACLYINGQVRDVLKLAPGDVSVEDIAKTLSQINRFLGRTPVPYTVAQHAVLVSYLCPPAYAYVALHHDDTEAYVGDLASPIKDLFPGFRQLERRILETALAPALGLPDHVPSPVHDADKAALRFEQHWIQGRQDVCPPVCDLPFRFQYEWSPELARLRYLARHEELRA